MHAPIRSMILVCLFALASTHIMFQTQIPEDVRTEHIAYTDFNPTIFNDEIVFIDCIVENSTLCMTYETSRRLILTSVAVLPEQHSLVAEGDVASHKLFTETFVFDRKDAASTKRLKAGLRSIEVYGKSIENAVLEMAFEVKKVFLMTGPKPLEVVACSLSKANNCFSSVGPSYITTIKNPGTTEPFTVFLTNKDDKHEIITTVVEPLKGQTSCTMYIFFIIIVTLALVL